MPKSCDDDVEYRTSSFSAGGACIEVAKLGDGTISIRDSRTRVVSIVVRYEDWTAFVAGVKNDEFQFP